MDELIITRVGDEYFANETGKEVVGPLKRIEENGRTLCLPKNNCTGRQYVAKKIVDTAIDAGEDGYTVPVRTTAHRSVADGTITYHKLNENLVKFLGEADAAEYNEIIARAQAAMDADTPDEAELAKRKAMNAFAIAKAKYEAMINGTEYVKPASVKATKKTLVEYISEEDYARYQELLDIAETAKANQPKAPRALRAPMTQEQKVAAAKARYEKAQKALEALLATQNDGE